MSRSGAGRDTGRPGALGQARELVALASSLSEAGDSLSADAVAARLGMGRAQAEKLVGLLATAATADGTGLPLVEDGDGALTLLLDAGVRGRRLKLNLAETAALLAALDRMGVAADDPLRERLEGSLPGDAPDEGLVHRMLGELSSGGGVLLTCARALREGMDLRFSYQGAEGGAARGRQVRPEGIRHEEGRWYLDAYDLGRHGERTFRLNRMEGVEAISPAPPEARGARRRAHTVTLTFSDARYLDLLPWHDLTVEKGAGSGVVRATIPYYGGMWLPRMVAACGGSVTADDADVNALAKGYARSQLRHSEECHEGRNTPESGALTRDSRARG